MLLGLVCNLLTVTVMRHERKKSSTILALLYLALSDLLVLSVNGYATLAVPLADMVGHFLLSRKLQFYSVAYMIPLGEMANLVSVFITVIVTWQRYVGVCKPHKAKTYVSTRIVHIAVSSAGLFSIIFHSPLFFMLQIADSWKITRHSFAKHPAFTILYETGLQIIISYIIPVLSLCWMTFGLAKALKSNHASSHSQKAKRDLTLSLIIIDIVFIICQSFTAIRRILVWVYHPYVAHIKCGGKAFYFGPLEMISLMVNSSANFFIFIICAQGFRKKLVSFYCKEQKVSPQMDPSNTACPSLE